MVPYLRYWFSLALVAFLSLSPCSGYAADQVLTVNRDLPAVGTNFHSIQAAIDTFNGTDAGFTRIDISPGTYVENIDLEDLSAGENLESRNFDLGENGIPNDTIFKGLQINGDIRPCFPQYQNGYENAANSTKSEVYTLTTSTGLSFPVLNAASFGTHPDTDTGPLPAQISNPIRACQVPSNSFAGGFAVIRRGTCGFATKTKNAQDAGAGAVIIVDNQAVGTVLMGGTDPTVTIPAFSISLIFGNMLIADITANPDLTITISPPATFYNPPIGTNFAKVTLSHPGGDFSKIQVTVGCPLPEVDPNLPRGVKPVLEQPVFNDPRLELVPGDMIILSESDIFGSLGRTVFEVAALDGNIITLTTPVDPSNIDITKLGSSLTFLPNVKIIPDTPREPVFTAQSIGFSMSGIWIDTNPDIPFAATVFGVEFSGVRAYLSNIIVTDTNSSSANGPAFDFNNETVVTIEDGWRASSKNRRLSSIGWSSGFALNAVTNLSQGIVFATNATSGSLFTLTDYSSANVDCLILMGNYGLFQAPNAGQNASGANVTNYAALTTNSLFTVTDIFGVGIAAGAISCDSFRLERIYKPAGGTTRLNALQIGSNGTFEVGPFLLYNDTGLPAQSIRKSSIIRDCFDIDPNALITAGTAPNVGIFVDDEATFISYKDLKFKHNSVDYLTAQDNQFITPGWKRTPGSIFQICKSGKLNSVYQLQEIRACNVHLTLDPCESFDRDGIYINTTNPNPGKTFRIISKNSSWHYLTLTKGHFLGTKYKTLRFKPHKNAYVVLKILSPTEVEVTGMKDVEFFYEKAHKSRPLVRPTPNTTNNRS